MADVRFLRHLRDNNPNKITLMRGKKVTAADALQAKLAAAKDSQVSLLAKLTSLTDYGKTNRERTQKSEQTFQWIAGRLAGPFREPPLYHRAGRPDLSSDRSTCSTNRSTCRRLQSVRHMEADRDTA
jgi:hypothetical protein